MGWPTNEQTLGGEMNIKLIVPFGRVGCGVTSAETFKIQQLNIPLLAAHTPAGHALKIVDESFGPDDMDEDVDLVGITVMTDLALRSYRIADAYRQRGVRVVMGGIHATVLPDESLRHADAVVLGEGEDVWPQLVSDAAAGRLQRVYRASKRTGMAGQPLPRRDLYPRLSLGSYAPFAVAIEASRGCPNRCEFCSVGRMMGYGYRIRPVHEVASEIESIDLPNLFFVDDNLAFDRKAARELFTAMIPLRRRWVGQGQVSLAEDLELLTLMRRSGCEGLLIGFESMQKETQDSMPKVRKLKVDYREAVRRFHAEGIALLGAFVFGFDHETKDVFDRTIQFISESGLEFAELRCLVPYPGTRLYQRLLEEGRLPTPDWWLSGEQSPLLFRPKSMTPDELLSGVQRVATEVHSVGGIVRRFFGISPLRRSAVGWQLYAGVNLANRRLYHQNLPAGTFGSRL